MKKQLSFLLVLLCFAGITVHAQQSLTMVEQFTSSTCYPYCPQMNAWLNPLLEANADRVVVVKYQMNWPGAGDPYYTAEGGTRRTYYGVSGVPTLFANGTNVSNQTALLNIINNAPAAQATITGTFKVTGNTITINGSVTPSISGSGYRIHVVVNEKITYGNKGTNGETEFHHVMMKMFPNGNGTEVTLSAGTAIPFSFTHNMSTTHVEEMDDLEVAVFVQNHSTRAILNAAFLEDITLPAPQSMTATQEAIDSRNVNITWTPPQGSSPNGYNLYRDEVKINTSPVTGTSYQDEAPEFGKIYTYAVGAIVSGEEGYWATDTVLTKVNLPAPINVTAVQTRGLNMLVSWEMPAGFEHPVKYYIYRNNLPQNPGNPTSETTFESTGLNFTTYCFKIEPVLNTIFGNKSEDGCVILLNIPKPNNLKAEQISIGSKEVLLTWDASVSNTAGYNIYRDESKINTELITEPTYTDVVNEFGVAYKYEVYGVAETGAESANAAVVTITLSNHLPAPQNVQAIQGEGLTVEVTWDAVTLTDVEGYNIFRNDEKINTELITEIDYLDIVPADGNFCYKVSVVIGGTESEKSDPCCVNVVVGISETDKDVMFTLYPNPVSGILNIYTDEIITDCQVFNIQGQMIYSSKTGVKEIATDSWASGIYIIRIHTEKGSFEKRFTKK